MPFDSINKTLICRLSKQPTPAKNVFATTSTPSDIALSKIVAYQQQKSREQLMKSENTIRRGESTIKKTALTTALHYRQGRFYSSRFVHRISVSSLAVSIVHVEIYTFILPDTLRFSDFQAVRSQC